MFGALSLPSEHLPGLLPSDYLGLRFGSSFMSCGIWGQLQRFSVLQCKRHNRCGFKHWVRKIPWKMAWQATPVFLLGESHRQRSQAGYGPQGQKELDMTEVP